MTDPDRVAIIQTFTGILAEGQRVTHKQTGHVGTVVDHAAGSYYIRWDAALPARWFEARLISPWNCAEAAETRSDASTQSRCTVWSSL